MADELLQKVVESIATHEREIIDEFCKAFMAHKSLEGVKIEDIFKNYTLCTNPFTQETRRHWFEKNCEELEPDFTWKLWKTHLNEETMHFEGTIDILKFKHLLTMLEAAGYDNIFCKFPIDIT